MKHLVAVLFAVLSLNAFSQTPSFVPTDGLVAWYPFNGNANDESGNGYHAEVIGVTTAEDRFGDPDGAYSFGGVNCCGTPDAVQEIAIQEDLLQLVDDFSVFGWFHSSNVSKYQQCIFNSIGHTGFALELNNEHVPNKLSYAVGPESGFWDALYLQGQTTGYTSGQWYHAGLVKTGTTYSIYLNGALEGQSSVPASDNYQESVGLRIGSIGGGHEVFKGELDEFGVWNRALSGEEIQSLYASTHVVEGCTDDTACNFNPDATEDDGSCITANIVVDDNQLCETGVVSLSVFQNTVEGEPRSLSFSQGQYVRVPNSPSLSTFENGITLECWYKQTGFSGGDEHIVGHEYFSNEGVELANGHGTWNASVVGANGSAAWNYWDDEDYNPPIVENQWHHVALSSDGQTTKYFLNGQEIDEDVNDLGALFSASFSEDFVINRHTWASGSSSRLSGYMDELRLSSVCRYTESFTPSEGEFVVDEFTAGLWHFNEGSGSTVYDSSPHGNHGTCLGTGWSEDTPITQSLTEGYEVFWNGGTESTANYSASSGETVEVVIVGELGSCSEVITIEPYELEEGCADEAACNYSETAACNLGCVYPVLGAIDCNEGSVTCGPGTVWDAESQTCVVAIPAYLNEPGETAVLNPCYFDTNYDGLVEVTDLMNVLSVYGMACGEIPEPSEFSCGDPLDYQGYDYETVLIGEQCWFAENARYLPAVSPPEMGSVTEPHAYVFGYSGSDVNEAQLLNGAVLYNGITLTEWDICPNGWHVPTEVEWQVLEMQLGMTPGEIDIQGSYRGNRASALKSVSEGWQINGCALASPGTDESGFAAEPVGIRHFSGGGTFTNPCGETTFWTSTDFSRRALAGDKEGIYRSTVTPEYGFSVRCIQD